MVHINGQRWPALAGTIYCIIASLGFGYGLAAETPDEVIKLTVPLHDGQYYSARAFCRECNAKLGSSYVLEEISESPIELTKADRLALSVAQAAGLMEFRISDSSLVLSLPNLENEKVRLRNRRRLERLFHISLTWPADKGMHLPDGFDPTRRTMLLIHGLEADATDLDRFGVACKRTGVQMLTFDYPNDGPIAWSGDRLRADLIDLAEKHPRLHLAIVAHSMGGLVARHALEATDRPPTCVAVFFLLGTPNHGSRLAGGQAALEFLLALRGRRFPGSDLLKDGLGEAADDLQPKSRFLNALNARHRRPTPPYYQAIGRRSFLTEPERKALAAELPELLERRKSPAELRNAVAGILKSDELHDGLGDGAVAVASARLEGAAKEKLFDLNHSQLLGLPGDAPEEAELFRWIMHTLRWEAPHD